MAKPTGRPAWFKVFLNQKAIVDSVDDATAGKALKAVFQYFATGGDIQLDQLSFVVFSAFKPCVDASFDEFRKSSEAGKAGNAKRWGKGESGGDTTRQTPIDPIAPYPEDRRKKIDDRGQKKEDRRKRTEGESIAASPPTRPRFTPPTVDDVRLFCEEHGYIIDPQRFIDFYESNGWRVGKNPMKSWQAAVRSWNSREKQIPNKPAQTGGYSHGLDKLAQAYKEEFGE